MENSTRKKKRVLIFGSSLVVVIAVVGFFAYLATTPLQIEQPPSYNLPIVETSEPVEKVVQASSQSTQKVEVIATPEPPPYQLHELGPHLLEGFYDTIRYYFKDVSEYDKNYRLSSSHPQYSDLVDRLINDENVFLDNNLFYDHIESWNHVESILFEMMDREGFNFKRDGYESSYAENKYSDLYQRLKEQDALYNWATFKKTAAEVLDKKELPLIEMFEQKLYEASVSAGNFSWYSN